MSGLCGTDQGSGEESEPNEHTRLMDDDNSGSRRDSATLNQTGSGDAPANTDENTRSSPGQRNSRAIFRRQRSEHEPTEEERRQIVLSGYKNVIRLFVPVVICMIIVVATVKSVTFYQSKGQRFSYIPFSESEGDKSSWTKAWQAIVNAIVLLSIIVVMTIVMVVLYKYRCYRILYGWLIGSSLLLLFLFTYIYLGQVFSHYNVPMDFITLAICIWNFAIVGMMVIHWKGPLRLQQAYNLVVSMLMAITFIKYLPDWTTWIILGVMVIWDLVAVLCPMGPLKILVDTATERDDSFLPGLIYSSTVMYALVGMADQGDKDTSSDDKGATKKKKKIKTKKSKKNTDLEVDVAIIGVSDEEKQTKKKKQFFNEVTDEEKILPHSAEVLDAKSIDSVSAKEAIEKMAANDTRANHHSDRDSPLVERHTGTDQVTVAILPDDQHSVMHPNSLLHEMHSDRPLHGDTDAAFIDHVEQNSVPKRRKLKATTQQKESLAESSAAQDGDVNFRDRGEPDGQETNEGTNDRQTSEHSDETEDDEEERGVRLGLGDFIFYSVLVGKASIDSDWSTTLACFIAILVGLVSTLLLLAIFRKALPALPISITFGLVFYFATNSLVQPFMVRLNSEQVYI